MNTTRHPHPWITHFGSLRATLALMGLLAAVVLAGAVQRTLFGAALAVVFTLLALQLLAGLVVHAPLRRQLPLLLAHLGLLALGVEVGLSRLMSLEGRFELTEGLPFDGQLIDGRRGALHRGDLQRLAFVQHGFDIDYAPGRKRGATRNRVSWTDAQGRVQQAEIGDHRPLVLDGHRITTTPNKGFAPVLQWQPDAGEAVTGAVHLPSYPAQELHQSREWRLPDGRAVWVMLDLPQPLIDPAVPGRFRMPDAHQLVLRVDGQRWALSPGDEVTLPGGRLRYLGLRSWMGYRLHHDPLLPVLLGTALASTLALAWHYARKFRAPRPQPGALPASGLLHGPVDA